MEGPTHQLLVDAPADIYFNLAGEQE